MKSSIASSIVPGRSVKVVSPFGDFGVRVPFVLPGVDGVGDAGDD